MHEHEPYCAGAADQFCWETLDWYSHPEYQACETLCPLGETDVTVGEGKYYGWSIKQLAK